MAFLNVDVRYNLKPLGRLEKELQGNKQLLELWAKEYRRFLQKRYKRLALGGDEWPPSKKAFGLTLIDTGTLLRALTPVFQGHPGARQTFYKHSVTVGYGGRVKHPKAKKATVANIAQFHQIGAGFLPIRRIIVPPTVNVRKAMIRKSSSIMRKIIRDTGNA